MEALTQRVLPNDHLKLADESCVLAKREVGVDAVLERREALLLEPRDLGLRERLVCEVRERRAALEGERLAQCPRRAVWVALLERLPSLGGERRETVRVDLAGRDVEEVARAAR
jgi:hypothetical protein